MRAANSSAAALLLTTCTSPAVGHCPGQRGQCAPAAAGAPARCEVELDVRGAGRGDHRVERRPRQRCPAQVGVYQHAGGVDDGPKARRGGGKGGDRVLGDALGLDLPGAGALLGGGDHGLHQGAAQHPLRLDQARIGEQDVGAGHSPARITHAGSEGAWRRRTGIEPASGSVCRSTVLKTAPVTRPETPPWTMTPIVAAFTPAGTMDGVTYRLTQYAHGGGCACKIPPGELEDVVRGLGLS